MSKLKKISISEHVLIMFFSRIVKEYYENNIFPFEIINNPPYEKRRKSRPLNPTHTKIFPRKQN